MKRKTLLKLTACGLVGALTIGNFTVAAYAAPTAGVASLASDIATTSSAPTAGFSLALSEVAEKVEDEATVASAQPEVKEVEAPVVKSEYEDKAVAVVDDYVNVRKKPTTDSKAVGKLYKNNVGTVIGEKDGWYKIKSGSVTGYVKSEFVSIGDEKKLKKAGRRVALVETETLKVRKGASQKAEVITLVPEGDDLTVLDESKDGWAKVSVDEGKGYVSTDYVTLSTEYTYAESAAEEKARLQKEKEEREAADRAAQKAESASQTTSSVFLLSLIRYMVDKSCHRHSVIKLYVGLYTDSGKRIFLPDLKHSPGFILCILHIFIFQITSGRSHHIFISMPLIWPIIASQFQLHQRKSFIHHPAFILLPAFLYGHILCLWNGRKV